MEKQPFPWVHYFSYAPALILLVAFAILGMLLLALLGVSLIELGRYFIYGNISMLNTACVGIVVSLLLFALIGHSMYRVNRKKALGA